MVSTHAFTEKHRKTSELERMSKWTRQNVRHENKHVLWQAYMYSFNAFGSHKLPFLEGQPSIFTPSTHNIVKNNLREYMNRMRAFDIVPREWCSFNSQQFKKTAANARTIIREVFFQVGPALRLQLEEAHLAQEAFCLLNSWSTIERWILYTASKRFKRPLSLAEKKSGSRDLY